MIDEDIQLKVNQSTSKHRNSNSSGMTSAYPTLLSICIYFYFEGQQTTLCTSQSIVRLDLNEPGEAKVCLNRRKDDSVLSFLEIGQDQTASNGAP